MLLQQYVFLSILFFFFKYSAQLKYMDKIALCRMFVLRGLFFFATELIFSEEIQYLRVNRSQRPARVCGALIFNDLVRFNWAPKRSKVISFTCAPICPSLRRFCMRSIERLRYPAMDLWSPRKYHGNVRTEIIEIYACIDQAKKIGS